MTEFHPRVLEKMIQRYHNYANILVPHEALLRHPDYIKPEIENSKLGLEFKLTLSLESIQAARENIVQGHAQIQQRLEQVNVFNIIATIFGLLGLAGSVGITPGLAAIGIPATILGVGAEYYENKFKKKFRSTFSGLNEIDDQRMEIERDLKIYIEVIKKSEDAYQRILSEAIASINKSDSLVRELAYGLRALAKALE